MEENKIVTILVIWRGHKFTVQINPDATLKEFGHKLQHLTHVKPDTMHLLIPPSSGNSTKKLTPFSDDHSSLSLKESSIIEGKSIRMMGVFEHEIKEVSQDGTKADLRIAGFDEEDRRHRQRMLSRPNNPLKLPQGTYIFCDFRTLHLPGIELNPPASEALKRMHMLAADPGIVAIMNKHHWRVGIMTEMAPVGYVGISPKCILGYNMNHGEEISLRLRTDDLKGFRKYESIKKTLLHELAHMIYSEHDANFHALDKQLNQEAATLDWTKSRSHTLSGHRHPGHLEEEPYEETTGTRSHKLGGNKIIEMGTARLSSVAAAYLRSVGAPTANGKVNEKNFEHEPDDSGNKVHVEPDPDDFVLTNKKNLDWQAYHDDRMEDQTFEEHKDFWRGEAMQTEPYLEDFTVESSSELNPDFLEKAKYMSHTPTRGSSPSRKTHTELDPDNSAASKTMLRRGLAEPDPDDFLENKKMDDKTHSDEGRMEGFRKFTEPDPDDLLETDCEDLGSERANLCEPDPDDAIASGKMQCDDLHTNDKMESELDAAHLGKVSEGCGISIDHNDDDSMVNGILQHEPDPDERTDSANDISNSPYEALDLNDIELQRIQDPVSVICTRLQKTIETLKSEVTPSETSLVLQTLMKIIRNIIEHPDDLRFRRLRKANPQFQKNVAKYKAAMEVLSLVGFSEDSVSDEIGRSEAYVVLKRNDPGLLWLAKSSLETCIAC